MAKAIGQTYLGITSTGTIQNLRSNGNLLINSSSLSTLDDVNISTPATNQALIYNSTTSKFENRGISFNSDLVDVSITSPQENQKLFYNSTLSTWINLSPQYYYINVYAKLKDSYMQSLTGTTYINLLSDNALIFDTFTITGTGNNGLNYNITNNLITGIRNTLSFYNYNFMANISILTINNSATFSFGLRNSTSGLISQLSISNTLNNNNKQLNLTSNTVFGDLNGFYPFLTLTGGSSYTGNTINDLTFSFVVYEL